MKLKTFQHLRQPTPKELTDSLLDFLRRKFYDGPGDDRRFQMERSRLLDWVVLWPAAWLNNSGVTLHGEAYKEVFFKTFLEADMHRASKIQYRPAWLRQVIQSHWKTHGEKYYNEAKTVRSVSDHVLLVAGQHRQAQPDPVREMANARQIICSKGRLARPKPPANDQLTLL